MHRKDREADRAKDRTDSATAQLQVERGVRSLVNDLATDRRDISQLGGEVSYVRNQTGRLDRERTI